MREWYAAAAAETVRLLETDARRGLTGAEARRRLERSEERRVGKE